MLTQKAYIAGSGFPPLEADKLRLYSMRFCPYAERASIVLAHKNIPHETVNINFASKPAWFLEKTPNGCVPVLQVNDKVIYESLVVCEYIDDTFPAEKVVPADPYLRAKNKMLIERFSKTISKYYAFKASDEKYKEEKIKDVVVDYGVLESELESRKSKFFGGDKPMLVDFVIWPHTERLIIWSGSYPGLTITADDFPLLHGWLASITSVPAVRDTRLNPEHFLTHIRSVSEGKPDYDVGLDVTE